MVFLIVQGLIVPAFEALTAVTPNPEKRSDLMKLLKKGTVVGYGYGILVI